MSEDVVYVLAVDRHRRIAYTEDDALLPITHFFNGEDECGPDEALTCVAMVEGRGYIVIELAKYKQLVWQ